MFRVSPFCFQVRSRIGALTPPLLSPIHSRDTYTLAQRRAPVIVSVMVIPNDFIENNLFGVMHYWPLFRVIFSLFQDHDAHPSSKFSISGEFATLTSDFEIKNPHISLHESPDTSLFFSHFSTYTHSDFTSGSHF